MFSVDVYALRETLRIAISIVKNLLVPTKNTPIYILMHKDLNSLGLQEWLGKWTEILVKDNSFISNLRI
jgi:hypothetical protein